MEEYPAAVPCQPEVKHKWYLAQLNHCPSGGIEVDAGCMVQGAVMYGHQVNEKGDKEKMHQVLEFIGNLVSQM